ncbi:SH3 domain-containing protein [Fredinandcohnia humi]
MKYKKTIIGGALAFGIGVAAFLPSTITASNNVILASVDWVTSQLNPINSKITALESKINSQQQEINSLKQQLSNGGVVVTPPPSSTIPSTVYVSKNNVTIHSGATRDYRVIATKSAGAQLKVIDTFNGSTGVWYRVEVSSTVKGWIFSGDISTTPVSVSEPSTVVAKSETKIRKGATTSYPVVKTVASGTSLKYISAFTNAAGETWYNVEISGLRGWVNSSLVEVKA